MTNYVLGFAFDGRGRVALARKTHPEWQAGKLNGVGGEMREGETGLEAMRREFREEAGVSLEYWSHFATLSFQDPEVAVFCYCIIATGFELPYPSPTDEQVRWYSAQKMFDALEKNVIVPDLEWLVPMAFPDHAKDWAYRIEVQR